MRMHPTLLTGFRWCLVPFAFLSGLLPVGLFSILCISVMPSNWCRSHGYFLVLGIIAAFGCTIAAAISAPKGHLFVGMGAALVIVACGFMTSSLAEVPGAFRDVVRGIPFSYAVGAILAVGCAYTYGKTVYASGQLVEAHAHFPGAKPSGFCIFVRIRQVARWAALIFSSAACLAVPFIFIASLVFLGIGKAEWVQSAFGMRDRNGFREFGFREWFWLYFLAAQMSVLIHLWISRTCIAFKVNWTALILFFNALSLPVYWVRVLLLGKVEGTTEAL